MEDGFQPEKGFLYMASNGNKCYLLGIDVGTTGCKTELIGIEGDSVSKAYREYPLLFPRPSWVEQDPEEGWWKATVETIQEVLSESRIDPREIAGVSISCTNALVPVDKEGRPLRKAIMQLDKRTVEQARWINENFGNEVFEINGNRAAAGGTSAPIILWIKENEHELFEKTYKFLWPGGFIVQRLTGEFTMEWSRASWTCLFDTKKNQVWSEKLCNQMGIPIEKLPRLCPSWEVVGEVTQRASDLTGLAPHTPVTGGMADTPAAGIGTRAVAPGRTFHVIGTVGRPCVVQGKPVFDSRFINCCHAVPNCWFTLGATDASGLSIKWFRDLFGQQEVSLAKFLGRNSFDLFDEEAEQSSPGAKGLIYLPYLSGERSPIWDPYSRGVLFGLSVSHTRNDVIRAILEGVAYSFLHNLKIYEEELGLKIDQLFLSGGGAKSRLWAQIHADMCNKPVHVVKVKESEALGNAILAGFAVGIYPDMVEAADRVVKIERIYEPNKEAHERYQKLFDLYKKLYLHLKEDFYELNQMMRED